MSNNTITITEQRFAEILAGAVAYALAEATVPAPEAKPARARKTPARKVTQPKADPKPTKGAQTRETLTRKDWNKTLCTKARLMGAAGDGRSMYANVVDPAAWARVQEMRTRGMSPDAVLATFA